jgi:NADPH:quinone reductase-like Zn-dependent oxidoreductase
MHARQLMLAWRVHEFGPPSAMKLEHVPRPHPGPGEILIKVEAAGVGPWDAWIRAGRSVLPQPLPLTLGSDFAGDVMDVGAGVTSLRVGDAVYGVTNHRFVGAYAEYAVAPASMVSQKPSSLTYIEAASVPVIAVTAWEALHDQARLEAGQTTLIHGAAGNVGAYAVQLARHAGVRTIATAAARDIGFVMDLGADRVIDYEAECFERKFAMSTPSLISSAEKHRDARFRRYDAAGSWYPRPLDQTSSSQINTASKRRFFSSPSRASVSRLSQSLSTKVS